MRRWARKKIDVKFKHRRLYLSYSSAEEPNPLTTPSLLPCVDSWVQQIFRSHRRKHCWELKVRLSGLDCISITRQALCFTPRELPTQVSDLGHTSQPLLASTGTGAHNKVSLNSGPVRSDTWWAPLPLPMHQVATPWTAAQFLFQGTVSMRSLP